MLISPLTLNSDTVQYCVKPLIIDVGGKNLKEYFSSNVVHMMKCGTTLHGIRWTSYLTRRGGVTSDSVPSPLKILHAHPCNDAE